MLLWNFIARLKAAEDSIAALKAAMERITPCAQSPDGAREKPLSFKLADALYQEAVRVDRALLSDVSAQAGLNYNAWNADYSVWLDAQKRADAFAAEEKLNAQTEQDTLASYGKLWLQNGIMPSGSMLSAMGLSKENAQNLIDRINGG